MGAGVGDVYKGHDPPLFSLSLFAHEWYGWMGPDGTPEKRSEGKRRQAGIVMMSAKSGIVKRDFLKKT